MAEIAGRLGLSTMAANSASALRWRRVNRIRTVHGSPVIEGNTLSEQQITEILEGKAVIAPPREVQEVRSALLAYELDFIHPFEDGNGRMGRLWQTLILSRWNPLFADLPVESIIYVHQQDYYRALAESNAEGASTLVVEFMLGVIREALMSASTEQVTEQATEQVLNLLARMGEGDFSAKSLMALMGLSHRPTFLYDYLHPAVAGGWLELTRPETPKSPKQGYRLTRSGRQLVFELRQHDGGRD
jgi:Fic family protein